MSYQRNTDVAANANLMANYNAECEAWQQTSDALDQQYNDAYAAYQSAHDAWVENPNDGDGNPLPEPQPPSATPKLPSPVAPDDPPLYEARVTTQVEQISTPTGPALIDVGRTIVTGPDGNTYAMTSDEFAHGYTEVAP